MYRAYPSSPGTRPPAVFFSVTLCRVCGRCAHSLQCTNCASACKRCDEARPCERCVKYGLAETCIDGVRKERKKGIKRGPYKRKNRAGSGEGRCIAKQVVRGILTYRQTLLREWKAGSRKRPLYLLLPLLRQAIQFLQKAIPSLTCTRRWVTSQRRQTRSTPRALLRTALLPFLNSTLAPHSTATHTAPTPGLLPCRTLSLSPRPWQSRRTALRSLTPRRPCQPRPRQMVRPRRTQAGARSGRGARTATRAPALPRRRKMSLLKLRRSRMAARLPPFLWARRTRSPSPSSNSSSQLRRRRPILGTSSQPRLSLRSVGRSRVRSWPRCDPRGLLSHIVAFHGGLVVIALDNVSLNLYSNEYRPPVLRSHPLSPSLYPMFCIRYPSISVSRLGLVLVRVSDSDHLTFRILASARR